MSKEDLEAKMARLDEHSTPPAYLFRAALAAYEDYVKELEYNIGVLNERVRAEVAFQHDIREQERKNRGEQYARHQEEKRLLVQQIGHAATTYNRVLDAQRAGRKTARIEDLLKEAS